MKYQKKIVLHCPNGLPANLERLVAEFRAAGVTYVGVVGKDCSRIEDIIDEWCVGLGGDIYFLLTASHPNETLAEALELSKLIGPDYQSPAQVIEC